MTDSTVYFACDNGFLISLNRADGSGDTRGPVTTGPNRVADLDRASGRIVWRWEMPEWPGAFANGFIASPTVADNRIVVGGLDGTLYAFPIK